jgi:2-polyprenyl-3-methyl-5-hydroxy-6-metoxy-1,4-benzoquinol methylase
MAYEACIEKEGLFNFMPLFIINSSERRGTMACVICGSVAFQFLSEKNNYRIERCSVCDLVQVTNMPALEKGEQGQDFYEDYYKDAVSKCEKSFEDMGINQKKLDQIEKGIRKKGKLLDVGCAFGFFLDVARQRGWTVAGIEISEYAAEYAARQLGLSVTNKTITEAMFEEKSFDVITIWYVIEHLQNPKQVLRHLSNFLKDDGMLVISTPNVDSYRARIQGKKWRCWIPPEHLVYFSPETMRNLLKKCALEIIDQETALPYEKYFRKIKLYSLLDKLKLSDNVIYYVKKVE